MVVAIAVAAVITVAVMCVGVCSCGDGLDIYDSLIENSLIQSSKELG